MASLTFAAVAFVSWRVGLWANHNDELAWVVPAMSAGAILLAAVSAFYNIIQKWSADRQKNVALILQDHITRQDKSIDLMQVQLAEKDGYIDELYDLHSECEIRETEQYGWMERATDLINRMARDNEKPGSAHEVLLTIPAKRDRAKRARYIREKSKFDSQMIAETNNKIAGGSKGS